MGLELIHCQNTLFFIVIHYPQCENLLLMGTFNFCFLCHGPSAGAKWTLMEKKLFYLIPCDIVQIAGFKLIAHVL